jgi:hypothetical protein
MSVQALLQQYQNTPRLFQLVDRLSFAQPQLIFLKNLQGSSPEFIIAAIFYIHLLLSLIILSYSTMQRKPHIFTILLKI